MDLLDQRASQLFEKLDQLFKQITPYKWYYDPFLFPELNLFPVTPEINAVFKQFNWIYNYTCTDYDDENQWKIRRSNKFSKSATDQYLDKKDYDWVAPKMTLLEFDVNSMFWSPLDYYPYHKEIEIEDSHCDVVDVMNPNYIKDPKVKRYVEHPKWKNIMMLDEGNYNIDFMPDEGGKIGQIIFVSKNESKMVADNILDFMEDIMIPKIEEIIQKHQKDR